MGALRLKKAKGDWNIELWVECPYCEEYFDFISVDRNWEVLAEIGVDVAKSNQNIEVDGVCPKCEKEFMLTEVSW